MFGCVRNVRNSRLLWNMSISNGKIGSTSRSTSLSIPEGCWPTAKVDASADFRDVNLIFGYGSLVWKPPCDAASIVESFPCRIKNFQRRFWQHSIDHRGTSALPGYVVTILDDKHPDFAASTEGSIEEVFGMAYRIRDSHMEAILTDLDFREKNGYTRTVVNIYESNSERSRGRAILYLAKPGDDPAYAGAKNEELLAVTIGKACGPSGTNIDYFRRLEQFCKEHGVYDGHIQRISDLLEPDTRRDGTTKEDDSRAETEDLTAS